jgi:drug/metabolite transporter (DMT)-like permease
LTTAAAARARNAYVGIACALLGSIGFSGKTIIIKLAYQYNVDVITLLALRMLFALPFFLAMAWWAGGGGTAMTRRDWITIIALGCLGYYMGSYLDFAGLQYVSAGLGRLILYLYPTLVVVFSALFMRQPVRARHFYSLALSYGGIALVFWHEADLGEDLQLTLLGAGLVFAGAVTYSIYLIVGNSMVVKLGSMRFTAYASTSASCFVIAHFLVTRSTAQLEVAHEVYALTLLMAVASTVMPLWLTAEGLKRIGPNQVSLVASIGPISTIALAYFFLGEPVTSFQLVGAALVLAGVMLVSLKAELQPAISARN